MVKENDNLAPVSKRRIGDAASLELGESDKVMRKKKKMIPKKKIIYLEIDDEITAIYDKIRHLKIKNIYLVVPKRAMLFQSIVNLKILKRKAEDIDKSIHIITNDPNGVHLSRKVGIHVFDKLEGHEHPSLVSGKFAEDLQDITPLNASINTLDESAPTRRNEKKFSLTDLIRKKTKKGLSIGPKVHIRPVLKPQAQGKKKEEKSRLVLVAPNKQGLIMLVILSVIILLTITYIALPGATIALTPKSNVLTTSVNIVLADNEANRAELDTHPLHEIPSYTISRKISKVLTYQSTGKEFKGENAKGVVTIINTSKNEWPLVAKTRFQTANGIVYRSTGPTTVPAAKDAQNPGRIDISVVADEVDALGQIIGDRGNIPPSKFFLPGLSADNQKKLFAESTIAFSSGKTNVIKYITKEDLAAAKSKMEADLRASAQAELQVSIKERNDNQKVNLVLLIGTDAITLSNPNVVVPFNLEGQKLESFDVKGEIIASGITYSKDDLLGILKTELKLKKNPERKLVHVDEDSFTYRIVEMDNGARKVKITATIKGIEEYEISPDKENGERLIKKIKEHILSKDIQEAETYIHNLPEIDKVEIKSWPAWAPNLPGIPDNIKIEIRRSAG